MTRKAAMRIADRMLETDPKRLAEIKGVAFEWAMLADPKDRLEVYISTLKSLLA